MTVSYRVEDVRARTHMTGAPTHRRSSSENGDVRPPLRLVTDVTHIPDTQNTRTEDHPASEHLTDATEAISGHPTVTNHPPTVAQAAANLWLHPDDARHGLPAQLGAAAVGLVQVAGLALCWSVAHVLFSTKSRTALFLLTLIAAFAVYGVATHL